MSARPQHTQRLIRALAGVAALGLAASLAACSSGGSSGGDSGGSVADEVAPGDPFAPETTDVSLTGIKGPGTIPLQTAADEFGAEYGLTIEPYFVDNSGVAVTSVISGDAAAANTSYFGVIDAIQQGLDLVVIAEGWASSPLTSSLEALPSSGITELADLEGKTVNVISLSSSHAIKLRDAMLKEGLDPDAVDWVELPYGEVAAALEQGTIDASSAVGPTLAAVRALGGVSVFDYGAGDYEGMAESGWVASREFAEANPNTIAAIQCSLFDAQGALVEDRAYFEEQFSAFLGAPPAVAAAEVMLDYQSENRLDEIQRNADVYFESGRLTEEFDLTEYVLPAPESCDAA
ncbi:ABC transporter substrate-binding protein [Herbiconiux sp. CPCC 203407]|uniref:ABC transporter substrate-binding protein n=1 Tax=Herbiconiux oxytropis TaxID=2970915 RepID=A0AA42BU29_9MICO|nr:ABC transporter substrate-binding protein [Herbiconiux oxytropis]MCS5722262.1 ABC transporter substrate-binding protein [Herbiconiux oxytropis]MCS5727100.1 ABC transporter substrate-binding protein [Herbiconiux oxytropis]